MVCYRYYWVGRSRSQRLCLLWPAKKQIPTGRHGQIHVSRYMYYTISACHTLHFCCLAPTSPNSPAVLVTVIALDSPSLVQKVLAVKLTTPWGSSLLSIIMVALPLVSEMTGGTKRLGNTGREERPSLHLLSNWNITDNKSENRKQTYFLYLIHCTCHYFIPYGACSIQLQTVFKDILLKFYAIKFFKNVEK